MGIGWSFSDPVLGDQLRDWIDALDQESSWYVDLFTFPDTVEIGAEFSDFTLVDWAGYRPVELPLDGWSDTSVTDHVASVTHNVTANFTYPGPGTTVNVTGYLVSDYESNLIYAESFNSAMSVNAGQTLAIQPVIRHANYPPPDESMRRGRTLKRVGRVKVTEPSGG